MSDEAVNEPLLVGADVSVWLPTAAGPFNVVKDIAVRVDPGEIVGLAGESGSGKSMLAKTIAGLLPGGSACTGRLLFRGENVFEMEPGERRQLLGREIGVLPQDPLGSLHPMLTVGRQVCEHMQLHLGLSRSRARQRAVELLDELRVPGGVEALERYPHQLSGGMRQRVALAIALACDPVLLIADEPTTALDVTVQAAMLNLVKRVTADREMGVLFITHDLSVLAALADSMLIMQNGRIVESGPTAMVLGQPEHLYTRTLVSSVQERGG